MKIGIVESKVKASGKTAIGSNGPTTLPVFVDDF